MTAERALFPWASVIRLALCHLRLSPETFWRMSLVELNGLLADERRIGPVSRRDLAALMAAFPDAPRQKMEHEDGR